MTDKAEEIAQEILGNRDEPDATCYVEDAATLIREHAATIRAECAEVARVESRKYTGAEYDAVISVINAIKSMNK